MFFSERHIFSTNHNCLQECHLYPDTLYPKNDTSPIFCSKTVKLRQNFN